MVAILFACVLVAGVVPTASAERVLPKVLECGGTMKAVAIKAWLQGTAPEANHYIYKKPAPGAWHQKHYRPVPQKPWLSTTRSTYAASLSLNGEVGLW